MLASGPSLWAQAAVLLAALAGCGEGEAPETAPAPSAARPAQPVAAARDGADAVAQLHLEVVAVYPHDPSAFTQGLLWHDGRLYEGTGLYGRSELRVVEPATGTVERRVALPGDLFGEGLARLDDRLYQLTWQAGIVRVYDLESLDLIDELGYTGEGWGLAAGAGRLVMSDGSSELVFRDPLTFAELGRLTVRENGVPLADLNELEWVRDGPWTGIWANVWQQDRIVRIDPESGRVLASADASGLLEPRRRLRADVLNGIAHDPTSGDFLLTGKLWPELFRVRPR